MNLKAKLQKMSIQDLRNVCRELGVSCPKTKRSIIKKLLQPLQKKYRMKKEDEYDSSQSTRWIAPGQPHDDIKIARTEPSRGTILHIKYKGTPQYTTVRHNSPILGNDPIIFSGKVLDARNYPNQHPPYLSISLEITKCSSRPELIGKEVTVASNRDQISIKPISN